MKKILLPVVLLACLNPAFAQKNKDKKEAQLTIDMMSVQGGKFDMGDDSAYIDRRPAHSVVLKSFSIGTYEVTQAQWKAIMDKNPSAYKCDDCPVTNVSWNDVQTFITKLNEKTGKHYRLPTEAEWEFAARGGVKENPEHMKKYSGREVLQYIAWFERNANDHQHPVGKKRANELGLHDMTGNVEEWTNDWYSKDYFSKRDANNPQGPSGGNSKVVRGGSWQSEKDEISVTRRAAYTPDTKATSLGFRLAM